jgi:tetraacyldisaccharide-1-P 4'-kinase
MNFLIIIIIKPEDLNFFDDLPIIMTEKDAVKCVAFAKNNFWCQTVIVKINLASKNLMSYLINKIKTK